MRRKNATRIAGAVLLAWAGALAAGEPPPGAAWIAHVDLARLAETGLGERIRTLLSEPETAARLDAFEAVFRFDPRHDLQSITLFGPGRQEEDAVAVVRGRFDPGHIAKVIRGHREYRLLDADGRPVHAWTERVGTALGGTRRVYGAFSGPDRFVFGQDADAVRRALEEALCDRPPPAALDPAAFLSAALDTGRIFSSGDTARAIALRISRAIAVEAVGAADGILCRMTLTAAEAGIAEDLKTVVDGMISALRLGEDRDPELAAMARGATVTRDGPAVSVEWTLTAADVERLVRRALSDETP